MRKLIIKSLALIFTLFILGSLITIYHLLTTTASLRDLINLHEIEDIRQELSFSIQKVQNYTYAPPEDFARNLDEVVGYASVVDGIVDKCHECHHEPDVKRQLDQTEKLIGRYQEQLSYLITTVTRGDRRRHLQEEVSGISDVILDQVQGMVNRAAATLTLRTSEAMEAIDRSYIILACTMVFMFIAAFFVARHLTRRITRPIDELLTATRKISAGELGYRTEYRGSKEFETLISTFNRMSESLSVKEEKIKNNLARLNQLHQVTLPLHSAQDRQVIFKALKACLASLIDAEIIALLLPDEENDSRYTLTMSATDSASLEPVTFHPATEEVNRIFKGCQGRLVVANDGENCWPFSDRPPALSMKNCLIVWLHQNDQIMGAIFAINKRAGDFADEDQKILGILANNITVALENITLYRNLQDQMEELQKTQRQLIEAEKLTALGTLAGGVAHDFNNILCGMIGYVALLKRNRDQDDRDYKMLDTIEKAGFRAANLTKQLLTFARQEMLEKQPLDINSNIRNVVELLKNTISKMITIRLELAEDLPTVASDPAQLEQVVMNLCVNARDAMPDGGEILIRTEAVMLDRRFCQKHPDARPGPHVKLTVADHGSGIDAQILPRIFEPFFTTKEFGKGTGLGLAMAYGIIKGHDGFCLVDSAPGRGTAFNIYLPAAGTSQKTAPSLEPVTRSLDNTTILIVDDEEFITAMLTEHLQALGSRTLLATDGVRAVELLEDNVGEIDLVVLDINMPIMDGREAFRSMKAVKPDLKVLLATGYALDGVASEILQKGADGFIQKPYSLEAIAGKIKEILAEEH